MGDWRKRKSTSMAFRLSSILLGVVLFAVLEPSSADVSKAAIAHVQCQVCEDMVVEAHKYAEDNTLRDEDSLNDMVESLCSVKDKPGRWVSKYDIVREDGDGQLTIERQPTLGMCKKECLIIQRACTGVLNGKEEKLVSMLQAGKNHKELKKMCKPICKKAPPKLSKWKDEAFEPRDEKEVETEDMIAKMKAETGMGMKMYKRDEMLSMSEGDMEVMAAREAYAQEKQAARYESGEL